MALQRPLLRLRQLPRAGAPSALALVRYPDEDEDEDDRRLLGLRPLAYPLLTFTFYIYPMMTTTTACASALTINLYLLHLSVYYHHPRIRIVRRRRKPRLSVRGARIPYPGTWRYTLCTSLIHLLLLLSARFCHGSAAARGGGAS